MPKYINADELKDNITAQFGTRYEMNCFDIVSTIMDFPAADVVEVVRCKDCKYSVCIGEHYFCDIQYDEWGQPYIVKPDGYCDCGERKETE